jgi:molybdenum cofactor guanylyltransferase
MPARPTLHTIGLILAGGRSTRMGGRDKALVTLAGQTLIALAVTRLMPQVDGLAINSNRDPGDMAQFGLPVIADLIPDQPGPLAGLHAGLARYPDSQILALAVDIPLIPVDLVARLQTGLSGRPCAYASDGTRHALAILCRPDAVERVRDYLEHGGRRVHDFLAEHGHAVVFNRPRDLGLFINLNTPEELARAEAAPQLINNQN